MPTYEYRCHGCGKHFEYVQSIKDDAKQTCEECGGKLERLLSAPAFVLKGGGWYKDLYSSTKGDSSSSSSSSPPSSPKSETKTETKTESKGSGSSSGSSSGSGSGSAKE